MLPVLSKVLPCRRGKAPSRVSHPNSRPFAVGFQFIGAWPEEFIALPGSRKGLL